MNVAGLSIRYDFAAYQDRDRKAGIRQDTCHGKHSKSIARAKVAQDGKPDYTGMAYDYKQRLRTFGK